MQHTDNPTGDMLADKAERERQLSSAEIDALHSEVFDPKVSDLEYFLRRCDFHEIRGVRR